MKRNPNTRNIFTKEGRLNRRIDKYNKDMALIRKMTEALDRLNDKFSGEEISVEELNNASEECVIRCDECSYEFDITSDLVEEVEVTKISEDGEEYIDIQFVCPKCGHVNEIEDAINEEDTDSEEIEEYDDADNSNDIEKLEEDFNDLVEVAEISDSNNSEESLENLVKDVNEIAKKVITIKNKNNKSHKVIVNKSKLTKFIRDEKIINAINIAQEHKSVDETISMLKDKDISLITANDSNTTAYSTSHGNISFICEDNNDKAIGMFIFTTRLMIVPHGNPISLYNMILSQLNIQKADNKFESIGLEGQACIIKLNDGSLAACNFSVKDKDLIMTIIYNINEDDK